MGHGHVFANAMTGNVVLLGIDAVSGTWQTSFRHLPPIVAFLFGVSVAQAMALYFKRRGTYAPYLAVLILEIFVLTVLSFLPEATNDLYFTITIAFVASVRVQTFREVNGRIYSSTFTTGNLRTLAEASFAWVFGGNDSEKMRVVKDFAIICAAFLLGATAGGWSVQTFGNRALWGDALLLSIVASRLRTN